jgi:hypothetical protein
MAAGEWIEQRLAPDELSVYKRGPVYIIKAVC